MRFSVFLVLILSTMVMSYWFVGLEADQFYLPEGQTGAEVFARLDTWIIYFMMPFARYEDGTFRFMDLDVEKVKRLLGVGLAFRSKLFENIFLRIGADLPPLEWIEVLESEKHFKSKVGIQFKMGYIGLETGVILGSYIDLDKGILAFRFREPRLYIAVGSAF
jgi:hypothetical protein